MMDDVDPWDGKTVEPQIDSLADKATKALNTYWEIGFGDDDRPKDEIEKLKEEWLFISATQSLASIAQSLESIASRLECGITTRRDF